MQTDRDQIHAYKFSTARLASALTVRTPGTGEAPFRRGNLGALLGITLGALICGVVVLYSVLNPAASTAWRQQGAIVVNNQTGTRYVYLNGVLRPTVNFASAVLISGSSAAINYIPASALAHVRVGSMIGIPGAPESLPDAAALLPGKWAVCLDPAKPGAATIELGSAPSTASDLAEQRIVVQDSAGSTYLVWNNVKYPLPRATGHYQSTAVLVALGLGTTTPIAAPPVWLAALPTGQALAPAAVPHAGKPASRVAGRPTRVGELFVSQDAGVQQYYVMLADGLAPISRTEFALMAAMPAASRPVAVSPAEIAATSSSADRSLLTALPDLMAGQVYRPDSAALCVRQSSPGTPGGDTLVSGPIDGGVLAPPGTGMIVTSSGNPARPYLITDSGMKYPLVGSDAVNALGYSGAGVHVLPAQVLALVPTGPALDVVAARRAVT